MQRFGACVVTTPFEWTGVCNISIIIISCVNCSVLCLFDRVLAPITSTWRQVSLHQPHTTSQVRLLLASVESHVLLSSIMLPPNINRIPRNGLHQMLASILFVSYQNFCLRRGLNYGQFRLDSLRRSLLLQCLRFAHAKSNGRLYGRCQQVMLSSGLKEWPVTFRVWSKTVYPLSLYPIWAHWHDLE
jgi:hypothetical protein